jgi:hypothetical protein
VTVFNLARGQLPVCGIALAFIVLGTCLAIWARRFAGPRKAKDE